MLITYVLSIDTVALQEQSALIFPFPSLTVRIPSIGQHRHLRTATELVT
jgi:hypothetical protein